jgi:threonine/homoserine/homoserine lactone efflux protein
MIVSAFVIAVLALLSVPGPTNTLLAASGAAVGFRRSLILLPMELGGYLISIAIWGHVIGPLAAGSSVFPAISKLLASAYLVWSAVRLWRNASAELTGAMNPAPPRQVFVTTLLNPKALIFALVIFPRGDLVAQLRYAALFSGMVVCVACCWIGIGKLIMQSSRGGAAPALVSRLAALALGIFAVVLAGSVVGATLGDG